MSTFNANEFFNILDYEGKKVTPFYISHESMHHKQIEEIKALKAYIENFSESREYNELKLRHAIDNRSFLEDTLDSLPENLENINSSEFKYSDLYLLIQYYYSSVVISSVRDKLGISTTHINKISNFAKQIDDIINVEINQREGFGRLTDRELSKWDNDVKLHELIRDLYSLSRYVDSIVSKLD